MGSQYLAFDFGTKYIGVAVGQDVTNSARPLTTICLKSGEIDWVLIKKIIKTWMPKALIVGIPYNMSADHQWITVLAKQFSEQLAQETQCVVHTIDERLSSSEAKEALFDQGGYKALKKEAIDAMAAKIILETWLQENITTPL